MERTDADDLELVDEPVGVDEPDAIPDDDIVDDDFPAFRVPDQRAAPAIETEPLNEVELLDETEPFDETEPVDGAASPGATELVDETALTERERQVLAFERRWWKHAGSKEQAIRDQFAMSSTRYYQVLNGLLDNAAALAHDPVLVKRLRRLRAARTRARSGGRVA